jgi:Na+/phosphate symporter
MTSFPFTTTGDFLVARATREVVHAEEIMKRAHEANDYFHEKVAAKVLAFYEIEHKLIAHYVELKLYFPESATALEAQKPYLSRIWSEAENELVQLRQESERT